MFNEIKDFAAPELDVYARTSEVQLLRYYEPEPGIFIAESPKVIERALNAGYQPISFLVEHKDLEGEAQEILKQYPDVPVYTAEYELLVKLTGFALTRGMLCAMRRNPLPSVEEICRNASRIAVLENVVNPTNIGAIFRSGGDTKFGLKCDAVTMWVILIPIGMITAFVLKLPIMVVYFIISMDEIIKLPAVYRHYKKYNWVRNLTELN